MGVNLCDLLSSNSLVDMTQKAETMKEKLNLILSMLLIIIINLCFKGHH